MVSTMHHSGRLARVMAVEKTTHLLAHMVSPWSLAARTVVIQAAGMAVISTDTPVTRGSIPVRRQPMKTMSGRRMRRIKV